MYTRSGGSSTVTPCYPSIRGEPPRAPRSDPEEGAVARHLHGPSRQLAASEPRWRECRRPPGVLVFDRQPPDRALFRRAPPRRPRGGEGPRLAGLLRDPAPARAPHRRGAPRAQNLWRAPGVPEPPEERGRVDLSTGSMGLGALQATFGALASRD